MGKDVISKTKQIVQTDYEEPSHIVANKKYKVDQITNDHTSTDVRETNLNAENVKTISVEFLPGTIKTTSVITTVYQSKDENDESIVMRAEKIVTTYQT